MRKRFILSAMALMPVLGATIAAAENSAIEPHIDSFDSPQDNEFVGFRNGSVVVAPIPFSNPTIGSGLVLGAGYLFNLDEESKPSLLGLAALRSDNGSEIYGLAANFAFGNNRWQIKSLYAEAYVNYDLYTSVGTLPISQDGTLANLSLSYGFTPEFSTGLSLRYLNTSIAPDGAGTIPPPFDQFLNMEIANVGLVMDWDTRDDTIYPLEGFYLSAEASRGYTLEGLTGDYSKGFLNYTHYFSTSLNGLVAARFSTCAASSETPFFDQCSLGGTDAFRGFSVTQYLDLRSASLQVEYRHRFTKRIGGVAFAGAGQTGSSFDTLSDGGTHTAFGLGARYRVSKKFPVDFSVDWSRNDEDEDQLYIYVGQRF